MPAAGPLRPGDVLGGRYRVVRRVATGGMGDVWQATDLVLERTVAVKVLLPALLGDPSFEARFHAEARVLATVEHPGVVTVHDYGKSQLSDGVTVAFLVMGYVNGVPLSRWIAASGRLNVEQTTSVVAQAAEALHAAHVRGVVHRDVKPANLLIDQTGTVVLVDFGVAHAAAATTMRSDVLLATPLYMAPEQVTQYPVSAATDVYALGAVMYHCLAGRPPFTGDSALAIATQHVHADPPPLPPDVPEAVRVLVFQALAKDPVARPPGAVFAAAARAAGRADALRAAITAGGWADGPTQRLPAAVVPRRHGNRRTAVAAAFVGVVALGVAAAATGLRVPADAPPPARPDSVRTSVPPPAVTTPPATTPPATLGGAGQLSPEQLVATSRTSPTKRSSRPAPATSTKPPTTTRPASPSPSPSRESTSSTTAPTATSTNPTPSVTSDSPTTSPSPPPRPTRTSASPTPSGAGSVSR
jgi:serine/threonine protein kinase